MNDKLTFKEAIKILCIEDYGERIFNSNSRGELFHLADYIWMAEVVPEPSEWFREWFMEIVEWAEQNWKRPESIFQHIVKCLEDAVKQVANG